MDYISPASVSGWVDAADLQNTNSSVSLESEWERQIDRRQLFRAFNPLRQAAAMQLLSGNQMLAEAADQYAHYLDRNFNPHIHN